MIDPTGSSPPALPLLLWDTPPGLELALGQEGVPFARVQDRHPLAFRGGRFVVHDSRGHRDSLKGCLTPDQVLIDVHPLRRGQAVDPFAALVDTEAAPRSWNVGGLALTERVGRYDKAAIRSRLVRELRRVVREHDGVWARLAPFPFPYRSAFNLRLDLDEPVADDYFRYARARRPLDDCTTHFVTTAAYGVDRDVLRDVCEVDAQSHGHHHVIYREIEANRTNLRRADHLLRDAGIEPVGFAAPHGRWNPGLDDVLEEMGTLYSSDFQLGYDDLPFFPWRADLGRFSRVLQVPVHPICEGLFADAGGDGQRIGDHWVAAVRAKVDAGDPAFVYGHPERRLGRYPEVVTQLAEAVAGETLLWRTTLTEFHHWWRWRADRRWSVEQRAEGYEVVFSGWDEDYPLALEVVRGDHVAVVPLRGPRTPFRLGALAYERRATRVDLPESAVVRGPRGLRAAVRRAIDWETVTPVADLPGGSLRSLVKRGLRRWQARGR